MTENQPPGGLLGKLLLPGFTDAGASTSFRPPEETTANFRPILEDDAVTEIHDNRSPRHSATTTAASLQQQQQQQPSKPASSLLDDTSDHGNKQHHSFFPTTRPNRQQLLQDCQPSPRPTSPPMVARRHMPVQAAPSEVPSTAAASVMTQIGVRVSPGQTSEVASSGVLGYQFLRASSQEEEEECESPTAGRSKDEEEEQSTQQPDNDDDDSETDGGDSFNAHVPNLSLIEQDSDLLSDVNSTASEFGTVINMSGSRMAEVEAMAALIESGGSYDDEYSPDDHDNDNGLSLPMLDSRPNVISQEPTTGNALSGNLSPSAAKPASLKDLGIEGNSGASAMVSAAIRRIGSGLHKKKSPEHSQSAPSTPGAQGVLEDLLRSTLTPNNQNHSYTMRSPGSAPRHAMPEESPRYQSPSMQSPRLLTPRFSRQSRTPTSNSKATPRIDNIRPRPDRYKATNSPGVLSPFRFAQKCFAYDSTVHEYPAYTDKVNELPTRRPRSNNSQARTLSHSHSWDVGGSSRQGDGKQQRQAFRAHPNSRSQLAFRSNAEDETHRARLYSDFSPTKTNAQELQTPQRIEIEREDALDILSCLVERGVSLNPDAAEKNKIRSSSEKETKEEVDSSAEFISSVVEEFRGISQEHEISGQGTNSHNKRMAALDELLRSHAYALEMKRASLSASSWLKSIGRSNFEYLEDFSSSNPSGGQASGERDRNDSKDEKMELVTLKALLHAAQMEARVKADAARALDEELSKCRLEIGRLKTASRADKLVMTPNRSILDDEADDENDTVQAVMHLSRDNPSPIMRLDDDSDAPTMDDSLFRGLSDAESKATQNDQDRLDVLALRAALEKANDKIRRMHHEVTNGNPGLVPPTIGVPELSKRYQPQSDDSRMVNVRMLNGENFVTEWDDLTPPLPPPPDHDLRSPIVSTVLEQWTTDRALHDSLMAWVEGVLSGDDLDSVPPLKISSLDHQVRDGFVMHVLPILLRRADIHVDVQTRAHRLTTYDIAVMVNHKLSQPASYSEYSGSNPLSGVDTFGTNPLAGVDTIDTMEEQNSWNYRVGHLEKHQSVAPSAVTSYTSNSTRQSPASYQSRSIDEYSGSNPLAGVDTFGTNPLAGVDTIDTMEDQNSWTYRMGQLEKQSVAQSAPASHKSNSAGQSPASYQSSSIAEISMRHSADGNFEGGFPSAASHDMDDAMQEQHGIMSALGGALGGLLSRRKYSASSPSRYHESGGGGSGSIPPALKAQLDLTSSPVPSYRREEDDQPYHRVVSAPPGRIGITFVEFRGHAMVSDVSLSSPLSGWVFPSDILIAIDEVPVSGMRVRDIIKVLTTRKDRQRALRVISSHAMNEFTLSTSHMNDPS